MGSKNLKEVTNIVKKGLQIGDSSSLLLVDIGTLIKWSKNNYDLASLAGKMLTCSEESFVDILIDNDNNALAFDFNGAYGLIATIVTYENGRIKEIKLTPEMVEK